MQINNVIEEKKLLRIKYKSIRNSLENKSDSDNNIFDKIIKSKLLDNAKRVFIYVSTSIEVDTHKIIKWLFDNNIEVAVPKCDISTCEMQFYLISSFDDLKIGYYGILEPDTTNCAKAEKSSDSVCIVPALSFDKDGFRLGFGKGYYDRFLSTFEGISVGLCYENCLADILPRDKYDLSVDFLITDEHEYKFCKED